ncbi:hypothetical protein BHE90_012851 [Fusarium euwallaceae]|uniref:Uncharacterized protein n=1 Tax=Fusarium euwallaceae TaxID=1147111 RepID=A0A430LAM8_9HYPO|nr:hypothetical protein BHE90_012851 [Fusarium euwallaceae]
MEVTALGIYTCAFPSAATAPFWLELWAKEAMKLGHTTFLYPSSFTFSVPLSSPPSSIQLFLPTDPLRLSLLIFAALLSPSSGHCHEPSHLQSNCPTRSFNTQSNALNLSVVTKNPRLTELEPAIDAINTTLQEKRSDIHVLKITGGASRTT